MFTSKVRSKREAFNWKKLAVPGVVMLAFWTLAAALWQSSGEIMALFFFGYIGTSVGIGLGLYAALPKKKKPWGRRLALLLVGSFLIVVAAIQGQENMQVEGLFFGLLAGVTQAAVVHYLIAKIFGPMLFGRLWCGWACWTVMVLDLLPFKRPSGRLAGKMGLAALCSFWRQPGFGLPALVRFWLPVGCDRRNGRNLVHHRQPALLRYRHYPGLHAEGQPRLLQIRVPGQRTPKTNDTLFLAQGQGRG